MMLTAAEKDRILKHAAHWFPTLVPAGARGFDDLGLLDAQAARPWYNRAVEGASFFSSTGTTGAPKSIPWTGDEDAWYVGEKAEIFVPFTDGLDGVFISLGAGHNAGSAGALFQRLMGRVVDAGLTPIASQCSIILQTRPSVLYCSPSILRSIMRTLGDGSALRFVRKIILNGEVVQPAFLHSVETFFGLDTRCIMDTYGTTEIGTVACTCPACGLYHFMDGLYPEAVPRKPFLRGGPQSVLVVSSVKRTSFPVIRLVTHDVVEGLERTECGGRTLFSIRRITGRVDDVLNYGELFPLSDFAELAQLSCPRSRWVAFNAGNDVSFVVEGFEPVEFRDSLRLLYPLQSRMMDLGLLDPVEIHFVEDFDSFARRAGIPLSRGAKDGPRIIRSRLDPAWLHG